MFIITALAINV